jgi:trehalose-6-phosphate synthase
MNSREKEELMRSSISYVEKTSTTKWVESFMKDLRNAYKPRSINYLEESTNNLGND